MFLTISYFDVTEASFYLIFYFLLLNHPVHVISGRAGHVGGEIHRLCSGVTVNKEGRLAIEPVWPTRYSTNAIYITGVN